MNNLVNDRLERLLPFLRGFVYNEQTLLPMVSIIFPLSWKIDNLVQQNIIIQKVPLNEMSQTLIVGLVNVEDKSLGAQSTSIDYLFDEIEITISNNQEIEKKQILLRKKIKEFEKFVDLASIEDIENFSILGPDYEEDNTEEERAELKPVNDIIYNEIIPESSEEKLKPFIDNTVEDIFLNRDIEIDSEIMFNPNMDLPPMPDMIADIDEFLKKNK